MSHRTVTLALTVTAALAGTSAAGPGVRLSYETGPTYLAQNDGRYGDAGTPFEASDVGQQDNLLRGERTTVELVLGRHRVLALYAPLEVTTQVALAEELRFRDVSFPAGAVVDHRYRFNGYRASYLYQLVDGALGVELGGSLQVRDADVAFSRADGSARRNQSDIGVVPALKARLTYDAGPAWAALEVDGSSTFGLVGDTSGALYDAALTVGREVRREVDLYANLRLVGGGAEVPDQQIDNWANIVSASLGLRVRFGE